MSYTEMCWFAWVVLSCMSCVELYELCWVAWVVWDAFSCIDSIIAIQKSEGGLKFGENVQIILFYESSPNILHFHQNFHIELEYHWTYKIIFFFLYAMCDRRINMIQYQSLCHYWQIIGFQKQTSSSKKCPHQIVLLFVNILCIHTNILTHSNVDVYNSLVSDVGVKFPPSFVWPPPPPLQTTWLSQTVHRQWGKSVLEKEHTSL